MGTFLNPGSFSFNLRSVDMSDFLLPRRHRVDRPASGQAPISYEVGENNKAWLHEQSQIHEIARRKLEQIRECVRRGKCARRLRRSYLKSEKVVLSYAIRVLGADPSRAAAYRLAQSVDPFLPSISTVKWRPQPKKESGHRIICSLPPNLKVVHKMVKDILNAQTEFSPQIHCARSYGVGERSGRDTAAREIARLFQNGFVNVAEFDARGCFASVNPAALFQLKLPRGVIENGLIIDNLIMERDSTYIDTENMLFSHMVADGRVSGPTGLMQGSPASSIIFAILVNDVLSDFTLPEHTQIVVCFDSFVVAAKNDADFRVVAHNLADKLRQCPFGPLALSKPNFLDREGLDFMGYNLAPDGNTIGLSSYARDRIEAKLTALEPAALRGDRVAVLEMLKVLLEHRNGYPAITDHVAEEFVYTENIHEIILTLGSNLLHEVLLALTESGIGAEKQLAQRLVLKSGTQSFPNKHKVKL